MSNTVVQTTLHGDSTSKMVIRRIHIISDGSEESDLVVYDNSTLVANTSKGNLMRIKASGSSCVLRFEWDASTDVAAISIDPANGFDYDLRDIGGLPNPGGSGKTGDLLLTTAGLDSADEVTIFLYIDQS